MSKRQTKRQNSDEKKTTDGIGVRPISRMKLRYSFILFRCVKFTKSPRCYDEAEFKDQPTLATHSCESAPCLTGLFGTGGSQCCLNSCQTFLSSGECPSRLSQPAAATSSSVGILSNRRDSGGLEKRSSTCSKFFTHSLFHSCALSKPDVHLLKSKYILFASQASSPFPGSRCCRKKPRETYFGACFFMRAHF